MQLIHEDYQDAFLNPTSYTALCIKIKKGMLLSCVSTNMTQYLVYEY